MQEHLQGIVLVGAMMVATILTVVLFAASDLSSKPTGQFVVAGVTTTATPALTEEEGETLQRLLAARGYDPGEIDGQYGPATAAAMAQAKQDLGLERDADVFEVLERLEADVAEAFGDEPVDSSADTPGDAEDATTVPS